MSEALLLREAYNEQMWERRANGIDTESFEVWFARREQHKAFFEAWNSQEANGESIAEALGA